MSWSFRPCTAQGGRSDGPIQQIDARSSRPGPDHALCLSGPGSTRHAEPTHPQSSPVRDLWLFGGIWNDLCFAAVPDLTAMLRRRSSAGMNPRMATIMADLVPLWGIGSSIWSLLPRRALL